MIYQIMVMRIWERFQTINYPFSWTDFREAFIISHADLLVSQKSQTNAENKL